MNCQVHSRLLAVCSRLSQKSCFVNCCVTIHAYNITFIILGNLRNFGSVDIHALWVSFTLGPWSFTLTAWWIQILGPNTHTHIYTHETFVVILILYSILRLWNPIIENKREVHLLLPRWLLGFWRSLSSSSRSLERRFGRQSMGARIQSLEIVCWLMYLELIFIKCT